MSPLFVQVYEGRSNLIPPAAVSWFFYESHVPERLFLASTFDSICRALGNSIF